MSKPADKVSRPAILNARTAHWHWAGLLCLTILATRGCDKAAQSAPEPLVVFAASSVADVLRDIADQYETDHPVRIVITQGASGNLCKQLELGAPCDVYLPADRVYLDRLRDRDLILGPTRRMLAGNGLVIVRPGAAAPTWPDPSKLTAVAPGPISMASPEHAPAGRYATEVLKRAGLWDRLQPRLVYADNVRLAARYVAMGGAQAGIVYATDALAFAGKLSVVYLFPPGSHTPIVYEAAVCTRSTRRLDASAFIAFAASEQAGKIWSQHGFARSGHIAKNPGQTGSGL